MTLEEIGREMTRERAIETLKMMRDTRFWWFILSATQFRAIGLALEALERETEEAP